ncbi:hypothetical protein KZX37_02810 [Microbacterium sp. EYE_5]|uniref:WD40 repeat domain-containing protein n=1 Tax=unclassified Microbacterium TaxID=2609290 RepID=UPI0020048D35|nr:MULTISPECIES: hypothetical protein [unclassified Microbacterium]MCK6079551.1 hypothetical protein [Microbacterium sp. EYE_382]MCK6084822.1 hypothetical protein [Microbacterium sp. EYE_384]MCK6122952.1 hypothetical protein [Microbacterium sp. EYE_80]MCK6125585.1 hypothetical protein [Microbacterium sp. EYE_79]MCK6140506.1 hypothetical protein [Microbacterium sp. EYE_39]
MKRRIAAALGALSAAALIATAGLPAQAVTITDDIKTKASYAVPDGGSVLASALSPDGRTAYLGTAQGIDVVDTATGERTTRVGSGRVWHMALSPDGTTLVALFDGGLRVIATSTLTVSRTITIKDGVDTLAFGPGGVGVYVKDGRYGLSIVNTRTGAVRTLTTFPQFSLDAPCALLPTPDGLRLYLVDCGYMDGTTNLWAINAKTGAIGKKVRIPENGIENEMTFSRNGKALYIPGGDIDGYTKRIRVYRVPEATIARTVDLTGDGAPTGVVAAGDGRSLYVAGLPYRGVAKMTASTGDITDYHELTGYLDDLRISADRSTLLVEDVENAVVHFLSTGE